MKKLVATLLSVGTLACLGVALFNQRPLQQVKADPEVRVIASDSDFAALKADMASDELVGISIRLDADVNYEVTASLSGEKAFRGTFDGNGHSITVSSTAGNVAGIAVFRSIGSNGTIKNLTIKGSLSGTNYIGGLSCRNYGTIINCVNEATITSTGQYVGGITGLANDAENQSKTASFTNCKNYGAISSTYSSSAALGLGGLVGYGYGSVRIKDSSNYGSVSAGTVPFGVGGILGAIKPTSGNNVELTNCYNGGDVIGDRYVGGILGHIDGSSTLKAVLSGCLNAGNINCTNTSKGYDGQLIGNAKANSSFELSSSAIMGKLTAKTSSNVGQVIGYPKADTYSGVSVATTAGVSDNVKEVIKLVRNFDCEADASYKAELNTALESLTSDEETMLSGVTYWDKAEGADKDYISAANYILGYSATPSRMNVLNKNNALLYIVIAISFVSFSGLVMVLVIRKKKTNL